MLAAPLEAEVDAYLERHRDARDDRGRALVVRNGYARSGKVVSGAGAIEVKAPGVDDRRMDPATGERSRFRSSIVPPYARRSPKVAEVLPLLYLHGLSRSLRILETWPRQMPSIPRARTRSSTSRVDTPFT